MGTSQSWKVRAKVVRMVEVLGCSLRLMLHRTNDYRRLCEVAVSALKDPQPEVRQNAKVALSSLFLSCTDSECRTYTQEFGNLSKPLLTAISQKGKVPIPPASDPDILAGVMGLSALTLSVPYHVPGWLPDTISLLARHGSLRAPDPIRREVEKCLQEFLRTHQDAWLQIHAKKFTAEQLDLLDMYKGRPIYFT
eukprot:GHVU01115356.1.p1 GENE.GHVU01115356.1~~GHVU01115356.1.p1  ORF type:complete len:221 (-),score=8.93 GHVU01115356.1:208-789(-)